MALDSEEESEQNETMKIRAALENPQTFGVPLLSALEKRHVRFRLKGGLGGANYGDFDWTISIRTLERVSRSGVRWSRAAWEGVRPQTRAKAP
jgi:hypothetical protein